MLHAVHPVEEVQFVEAMKLRANPPGRIVFLAQGGGLLLYRLPVHPVLDLEQGHHVAYHGELAAAVVVIFLIQVSDVLHYVAVGEDDVLEIIENPGYRERFVFADDALPDQVFSRHADGVGEGPAHQDIPLDLEGVNAGPVNPCRREHLEELLVNLGLLYVVMILSDLYVVFFPVISCGKLHLRNLTVQGVLVIIAQAYHVFGAQGVNPLIVLAAVCDTVLLPHIASDQYGEAETDREPESLDQSIELVAAQKFEIGVHFILSLVLWQDWSWLCVCFAIGRRLRQ